MNKWVKIGIILGIIVLLYLGISVYLAYKGGYFSTSNITSCSPLNYNISLK